MTLMTLQQFEKKSRGSLMRFIIGYLKTQSKKQVAIFAYTLAKSKLPRLRTVRQKALPRRKIYRPKLVKTKKGYVFKRQFSPKQLAAQRLFAKRARAGTLRKRRR
tara:strand:- start:770 stop:1084 length:315 start_codon:yes stop_codon:yes gene_type:complete